MTIINLNEMYSSYYISQWKKEGLPLITERPPTTTEEILNRFFEQRQRFKNNKVKKQQSKKIKTYYTRKKLDWRDYIKEEYK